MNEIHCIASILSPGYRYREKGRQRDTEIIQYTDIGESEGNSGRRDWKERGKEARRNNKERDRVCEEQKKKIKI